MPCDCDGWPESPYDIDWAVERGYKAAVEEIKRLRLIANELSRERNRMADDISALQSGFLSRRQKCKFDELVEAVCSFARKEIFDTKTSLSNYKTNEEIIAWFLRYKEER